MLLVDDAQALRLPSSQPRVPEKPMKPHPLLPGIVAASLFFASASADAADADLSQLAWLAGCWSAEGAEPGSGEQWMPLAGGSLLGMSRTVRQQKTVAFEFMRIAPAADGQITFFAQPSGKPPASFPARSLDEAQVVFENLDHDFPQRVIYRFVAPAQLRASIEGMRGGSLKRIEFPMVRVSCDAQRAAPEAK
jgi:hypothetical protein